MTRNSATPNCSATAAGCRQLLAEVRTRWQWLRDNLDKPSSKSEDVSPELTPQISTNNLRLTSNNSTVFHALQDHSIRAHGKAKWREPLQQLFSGSTYQPVLDRCNATHQTVLKKPRVHRAAYACGRRQRAHQHPVNSDDYEMLQQAYAAVDRIMRLARIWACDFRRARHRHHQIRLP